MSGEAESRSVVWEWLNDRQKWSSYSPDVCHLLERAYDRGLNLVCLGDAEIGLKTYMVNLREFQQISEVTGFRRAVRRRLFGSDSVAAAGVSWQWQGDKQGQWFIFDMDIATVIENSFQKGIGLIDLSEIFYGYNYSIDLIGMTQRNNSSGFLRAVRRILVSTYPLVKLGIKTVPASPLVNNMQETASSANSSNYTTEKSEKRCSEKTKGSSSKKGFIKQFTDFASKIVKLASHSEFGEQQLISDGDTEKSLSEKSIDGASNGVVPSEAPPPPIEKKGGSFRRGSRKKSKSQNKGVGTRSLRMQAKDSVRTSICSPFYGEQIKPVPGIKPPRTSRSSSEMEEQLAHLEGDDIILQFCKHVQDPSLKQEDCIICCEELSNSSPYNNDNTVVSLQNCQHNFHIACLKAMYNSGMKDGHLQCPTCKTIYGIKRGNQPRGTMDFHVIPRSLPGYSNCDTICITYNIPPGIQGPEHIHPGKRYTARGFPRICYLPNNDKGRKVLRLLVKAWERRLLFTIGVSTTTGEEDTVTWNEIHHKTEFISNYTGHGWPDPHYMDNVLMELAIQGVVE